jgi:hypothetical protein
MKLVDFVLGCLLGYALVRRRPPRPPATPAHLLN